MKSSLHTLRATASFPAWWHLVPLAISGSAIVVACAVELFTDTGMQDLAHVEVALAAPTHAYSDDA